MRRFLAATGLLCGMLGSPWALAGGTFPPLPPEADQLNQAAAAAPSPAESARLYARSIRLHASNGPALLGLGQVLTEGGRPADALKVLRRLDTLFPEHPSVQLALAAAIARLPDPRRRDIREGLALAERAAELEPGTPEAWHLVSVLRYLDGDYLLAAEAARHAIELAAQSPSPPADLARYQQQETTCNLALSVFSPLD